MASTERHEVPSLIGSCKGQGTAVYGAGDKRIGSVERLMIDKVGGNVAYAILSSGGFLGLGEDYYPVPWSLLDFDDRLGGYRTNLTREQLANAPKYARSNEWDWTRESDHEVSNYYRMPPYWGS
jgi:hypothetical protein